MRYIEKGFDKDGRAPQTLVLKEEVEKAPSYDERADIEKKENLTACSRGQKTYSVGKPLPLV